MANIEFIENFADGTATHFKEKIQAWLYMSAGAKVRLELESSYGYKHSLKHGVKQLTIRKDKGEWHAGRDIHFLMNGVQFAPVVPAYIGFIKMRYNKRGLSILMDDRTLQKHELENFVLMDGFKTKKDFIAYHFNSTPGPEFVGIVIYFGYDFKI